MADGSQTITDDAGRAVDGVYTKSSGARHELKYFVAPWQVTSLQDSVLQWCTWDRGAEGYQEIISLYYDTPDRRFYWDREESVGHRRKVRLRFYRSGEQITFATLEIKEKHKHLVVKKRVSIPPSIISEARLTSFSLDDILSKVPDGAVKREVQYLHERFNLLPAVWIVYDRASFVGIQDRSLRLTIDSNVRASPAEIFPEKNLTSLSDFFGENRAIFEVKSSGNVPLWLTTIARQHGLSQSRASKYCSAIKKMYLS